MKQCLIEIVRADLLPYDSQKDRQTNRYCSKRTFLDLKTDIRKTFDIDDFFFTLHLVFLR